MRLTTNALRGIIVAASAAIATAQAQGPLRNVVYYDQFHNKTVPDKSITGNITHVIMAFADSALFNNATLPNPMQLYQPFDTVPNVRQLFGPGTKVGISVGGWGLSAGFSEAVKTNETQRIFVTNVLAMVNAYGFDLLDIDWEFPGGNGEDYLWEGTTNDLKKEEPAKYPLLLEDLRAKLDRGKELTTAAPGKAVDMIAFNSPNSNASRVFGAVDFVNVMAYDFINRRDTVTKHHANVTETLEAIQSYKRVFGLDPAKINLGFPFYAKYFELPDGNCLDFGCPIVPGEIANSGRDANTTGAMTFERFNHIGEPAKILQPKGACGPHNNIACNRTDSPCCSRDGFCGNTTDYCGFGCVHGYGQCDPSPDMIKSFQNAMSHGTLSQGGMSYIDTQEVPSLGQTKWFFWTWESPETIRMKFDQIVKAENLGGVFAWSLGEDSYEWAHMKAINAGVQSLNDIRKANVTG